jgi:DNA-binding LacI/PurR family transcriptional regulator
MQRMMQASGLPVAVFGHPYPSLGDMPFVDRDQKHIGRLSAEYLLRHGHPRIAILMRQRMLPGDHLLIEGAREVAAEQGLGAGDFLVYCLSPDEDEVRFAVESILEAQVARTGFIARSPTMARITWELLGRVGPDGRRAASLVVTDYFEAASLPYPCIRTEDTVDSQGRRLGRLIHDLACGLPFNGNGHLVPVRLREV